MNSISVDKTIHGIDQNYRFTKTINVRRLINSALVMFIVCESMMNTILVSVFPIDNLLGYTMLLLGILVLIVQRIKLNYKIIAIVLYCLVSFGISGVRGYFFDSMLYLIQFLSFGMVGIIGARVDFNRNVIFKSSIVVSEIFIVLNLLNRGMIDSDFNFGYAIIPGVLSSLVLIYNNFKEKRYRKMTIYVLFGAPIFFMFVFRSSRGNIVQFIVFVLLGLFFLFGYKKIAVIISIIGIFALTNLREIVFFLNNWINAHGLTISVISKTYYLLNTSGQNLSHGRRELFDIAKQNIDISTLLIGNGIGAYEHVAGSYPHNIFLSAFCDFGIVGILFLAVLLYKFFRILSDSRHIMTLIDREFVLLMFILSFIKLCFSGVYWNSSTFWYLVSYLF